MNICCVLNSDGGTLKTLDLTAFSERLTENFTRNGHAITITIVQGESMLDALEAACAQAQCDAVLVGGGDGTISAAAAIAYKNGKRLAVLPAGTMNLFARALGTPLELDAAVEALAQGTPARVDLARIDDAVFIHQLSLGLHPRMIKLRDARNYRSRWGKIAASFKAFVMAVRENRSMPLTLAADGETPIRKRSAAVSISNNLFGTGHLPYPDRLDRGVLGVYVSGAHSPLALARLAFDTSTGHINDNPSVDLETAHSVRVEHRRGKTMLAVVDGELKTLPASIEVHILPRALEVILPKGSET